MKTIQRYVTLIIVTFTLFIGSCDNNSGEPPCIACPIDFSLIDSEPAWSPDGQWIAFVHVDFQKTGIYLIRPDGSEIKQWHDQLAEAPAWSPDGRWIAFSQNAQIWKKKIDGDSLEQLTFEGRNFFPSWSPDGKWIAFDNTNCGSAVTPPPANSCGIIVLEIESHNIRHLTSGRFPNWKRSSVIIHTGLYYNLYEFDIIDSTATKLTSFNTEDNYNTVYYPRFSNAVNQIALSLRSQDGPFQIWTLNADGSNVKQLTDTQGYSCAWSPDGKHIIYTDSRKENGRLWIMDEDGKNKRQLTFEHHFSP